MSDRNAARSDAGSREPTAVELTRPGQRPVVVVGAAMAGLRAAEQLRAAGYAGPLTVVGDEPHLPYNRPPLSKEALSLPHDESLEHWHAQVEFRRRASVDDVTWLLGKRAVAADITSRTIKLDDGETLNWSGLVVATGLRPRRLAADWPAHGRLALRSVDDALRLRSYLRPGARVVVVGAGFIGCEIAATARTHGCEVTVVEPLDAPLVRPLGDAVGAAVRAYHERSGITFDHGRAVSTVRSATGEPDRVAGVVLDDGTDIECDVIVEAIGAAPNVEWLADNGLDLSDGVLCDAELRVEGRERVVAVGDIARFSNPRYGPESRRVEHWCIPTDTAKRAARTLGADLGVGESEENPFSPLPSFWSDQGDLRLQSFGAPDLGATATVVEGSLERIDDGVVVDYTRAGDLVGVLLINRSPKTYRASRTRVDDAYRPTEPPEDVR